MAPHTPRQLALGLGHAPRLGSEDFFVTPSNRLAHGWIERWPAWPARSLLLTGPPGSGRTHLAAIWAERAGASVAAAAAFDPGSLAPPAGPAALVVEDIDVGADDAALFHALNAMREAGGWLLLTSARRPGPDWPALPDLASRLRQMPATDLDPPDDALLHAVLAKLFDERQILVDPGVLDYLMRRMERSLAAAARLVAALDGEALARGRRVSRALAAELFAANDADGR